MALKQINDIDKFNKNPINTTNETAFDKKEPFEVHQQGL